MNLVERSEKTVLPLPWAVYWAVHKFVGSVAGVAAAVGMSPGTLQKKIKVECDSHHTNLEDLENIIHVTQDVRILESICAMYGVSYVRPDEQKNFASSVSVFAKEVSDYLAAISNPDKNGDGVIDEYERAAAKKEAMELVSVAMALVEKL